MEGRMSPRAGVSRLGLSPKMLAGVVIFILIAVTAFGADDPFEGYWRMKDGNFILSIEREAEGDYSGHVVWLKNPRYPEGDKDEGQIQVDRNNPDPALRKRPVLGLEIVDDLQYDGRGLKGGWVYDSWHGKRYYGRAEVEGDDLLKLRGSVDKYGILGYTMKAYRVPEDEYERYGLKKQKRAI